MREVHARCGYILYVEMRRESFRHKGMTGQHTYTGRPIPLCWRLEQRSIKRLAELDGFRFSREGYLNFLPQVRYILLRGFQVPDSDADSEFTV